jgi:hypothetical protein
MNLELTLHVNSFKSAKRSITDITDLIFSQTRSVVDFNDRFIVNLGTHSAVVREHPVPYHYVELSVSDVF